MELANAEYLYTLAIIAITFVTISALVTVVRQIKGGPLSAVDIHLLTTFISSGFAQCVAAMLPATASLLGLSGPVLWATGSGASALLFAVVIGRVERELRTLATRGFAARAVATFVGLWLSVALFIINALPTPVQGAGLHGAAVLLSLAAVMWSFVRRLSSLGREASGHDWDVSRG